MLRFSKMHGIGNDFVIVDARATPLALTSDSMRRLADRRTGVGFDQLLTIEPATRADCAFAYGIWNADGTSSGQCGNGLRCVARWLDRAGLIDGRFVRMQSPSGPVDVELLVDDRVRAAMGEPDFAPENIPLALGHVEVGDALDYQLAIDHRSIHFGAVSIGNPHAVIEVADIERAEVADIAPLLERSAAFPEHCNVGFVEIVDRGTVRLRVWERGVGETLACGSGACAAVAVSSLRGRVDERVSVHLPGGALEIEWTGPGHALSMTGPASFVFEGEWHG